MPKITFVEYSGKQHTLDAPVGLTLMQVATTNLIPGVIADCGGYCNCATCHGYIEQPWADRIPPRSQGEADLLECAPDARATSRLTCQIPVTEAVDGIVVHLPKSQS